MSRRLRYLLPISIGIGLVGPATLGHAQSPPAAPPTAPPTAPDQPPAPASPPTADPGKPDAAEDTDDTRLRRRAAWIEGLLDESLDPEIDPAEVLRIDLTQPPFSTLSIESVPTPEVPPPVEGEGTGGDATKAGTNASKKKRPKGSGAKGATEPEPEPPKPVYATGQAAFSAALERLARTPRAELDEKVRHQREKYDAFMRQQADADARARSGERARIQAERLEQLFKGELPNEEAAAPLFEVDLSVLTQEGAPAETEGADPAAPDQSPEALSVSVQHLLSLEPAARQALIAAHERKIEAAAQAKAAEQTDEARATERAVAEAEEAARLRDEALAEAAKARSELERAQAEERARLRGLQVSLATFEAELEHASTTSKRGAEHIVEFRRHVRELQDARWTRSYDASLADAHYAELVSLLKDVRVHFRELMAVARDPSAGVPEVGEADQATWRGDAGDELQALYRDLSEQRAALVERAKAATWASLETTRDDMVTLNELRLELLRLVSPARHAELTGVGVEGVAQVRREFEQIALELNYQSLSWPRLLDKVRTDARVAPLPFAFGLIKLALVMLIFRWWRRRAEKWLEGVRASWSEVRPQTRLSRFVAGAAWYAGRIRKPLEWFALGVVLISLIDDDYVPEVGLLRVAVLWILGGAIVIRLLDAVASREDARAGRPTEIAELRTNSMWMVGRVTIAVGLTLSAAQELVGRGAIYAWVSGVAWIAALPMLAMLVIWWKPAVYERFRKESGDGAFRHWILDREDSWLAYPVALLGGAFILARQIGRAAVRQASNAEVTRSLLAYLFRREVAKRASGAVHSALQPLPEERAVKLFTSETDTSDYASAELDKLLAVADVPTASLSAVVGPRGGGKSAFLGHFAERAKGQVVKVRMERDAKRTLVEQLRAALEANEVLTSESEPAEGKPWTIVLIDDVHLCVQPSVGGMDQLDEFVDYARDVGRGVSWVFTVSTPAWQYISRARGDRMFLDQVVNLPRWSEDQLRDLATARAEQAELELSFDDLVVPRQFDDRDYDERERTQVGFFRILADASGGIPMVALHFWASSMGMDERGVAHVRLFQEPSTAELERANFNALFVLRAILQMEWASSEQIIECTRLGRADVLEALRYCSTRGYLERRGDHYRISLHWLRAISRLLARQHLLVS